MIRFLASAVAAVAVSALMLTGATAQQPPQQQPPQQQPPSPTGATGGPAVGQKAGLTIASDSLLGTTVKDQQGKDVGEISKLMIDPNEGKVTSVVIRRGGTLGIGGKELSLPWDALKLQRGQDQRLVVTMQREMLEQAEQPRPSEQPAASPPSGDRKP